MPKAFLGGTWLKARHAEQMHEGADKEQGCSKPPWEGAQGMLRAWLGCSLLRSMAGCFQKDWERAMTALTVLKDGIHLPCWELRRPVFLEGQSPSGDAVTPSPVTPRVPAGQELLELRGQGEGVGNAVLIARLKQTPHLHTHTNELAAFWRGAVQWGAPEAAPLEQGRIPSLPLRRSCWWGANAPGARAGGLAAWQWIWVE